MKIYFWFNNIWLRVRIYIGYIEEELYTKYTVFFHLRVCKKKTFLGDLWVYTFFVYNHKKKKKIYKNEVRKYRVFSVHFTIVIVGFFLYFRCDLFFVAMHFYPVNLDHYLKIFYLPGMMIKKFSMTRNKYSKK